MKYVIKKTRNEKYWFFTLNAKNGQIIVTSEMYETKQACRKGINAVKKALFAKVEDLS